MTETTNVTGTKNFVGETHIEVPFDAFVRQMLPRLNAMSKIAALATVYITNNVCKLHDTTRPTDDEPGGEIREFFQAQVRVTAEDGTSATMQVYFPKFDLPSPVKFRVNVNHLVSSVLACNASSGTVYATVPLNEDDENRIILVHSEPNGVGKYDYSFPVPVSLEKEPQKTGKAEDYIELVLSVNAVAATYAAVRPYDSTKGLYLVMNNRGTIGFMVAKSGGAYNCFGVKIKAVPKDSTDFKQTDSGYVYTGAGKGFVLPPSAIDIICSQLIVSENVTLRLGENGFSIVDNNFRYDGKYGVENPVTRWGQMESFLPGKDTRNILNLKVKADVLSNALSALTKQGGFYTLKDEDKDVVRLFFTKSEDGREKAHLGLYGQDCVVDLPLSVAESAAPAKDENGNPIVGEDGKPVMGEPGTREVLYDIGILAGIVRASVDDYVKVTLYYYGDTENVLLFMRPYHVTNGKTDYVNMGFVLAPVSR